MEGLGADSKVDPELQEFLMLEKQKAQVNAQVRPQNREIHRKFVNCNIFPDFFQIHEFNEICWDKCVEKPGSKLDGKTETCLNNCVDRFIDTSLLITNRFSQLLQKQANALGQ